jgi:tRNA/rRNA methyltransferase
VSIWTYVLKCADGSYYTGHTDDLEQRIGQHHSGFFASCYTFDKRPVELVWAEDFQTREQALIVERQIKGWPRAKKEALIAGDFTAIQRLAKKDFGKGSAAALRYGTSHSLSTYSGRTEGGVTSNPDAVMLTEKLRPGGTEKENPNDPNPFALSKVPSLSEVPVSKGSRAVTETNPSRSHPIIILVRPQLGENIGKAARAMLNFGLTELRLVAPRDGWPNPAAGPAASGADVVLAKAQVFETLAEATADIAHVYATTVRKRGITKPVLTPEEAAREMHGASGRSAILFGAERSGLDTDDVALARTIITVPINPDFGSLNLAQAVILCAYEWSKKQNLASPPKTELDPPASQFELDGLIGQLDAMLEPLGYFKPEDRAPVTRRTLRNLLTKPGWNALEVRTLRGVLTTLSRHRKN